MSRRVSGRRPDLIETVREIAEHVYLDVGENNVQAAKALGIDKQTLRRIRDGETYNVEQLSEMCKIAGGPIGFFRLHPAYSDDPVDIPLAQALRLARRINEIGHPEEIRHVLEQFFGLLDLIKKEQSA